MTLSRRAMLKTTAGGFATLAWNDLPEVLAAQDTQAAKPLERIRIGHIGLRNQGNANLRAHLQTTVALCDVDRTILGQRQAEVKKNAGRDVAAYADYRRLLDDKNVDAVVISAPDHWHALMAIHACQAGKHVYCEKPLTLTIEEGRTLVKAAAYHKVIVQTGSQQRSDERFRRACELVRNGKLGKISTVRVGLPGVNFNAKPMPDSDPPENLNYDLWLGPAPHRPYNVNRVHYNFRFFWDYSGGQLTNWGAHHLDILQWALGMDDSGPTTIEGQCRYHPQKAYEVPQWFNLTFTYPQGIRVLCGQDHKGSVTFEGSGGTLHVTRGSISANPPELLKAELGEKDIRLYVSRSHHQNWLDCIRTNRPPICAPEIGHRSATVCHLGNIALKVGRRIQWDPAKETVVGDDEAQKLVGKPYREPWRLPEFKS